MHQSKSSRLNKTIKFILGKNSSHLKELNDLFESAPKIVHQKTSLEFQKLSVTNSNKPLNENKHKFRLTSQLHTVSKLILQRMQRSGTVYDKKNHK